MNPVLIELASALEVVQIGIPGRRAHIIDAAVAATGAGLGMLLAPGAERATPPALQSFWSRNAIASINRIPHCCKQRGLAKLHPRSLSA